ncbi:hypothetical protein D3C72_1934350 [compost metagenome]
MILKQIAKECPLPVVGDEAYRAKKVVSMSKGQTDAYVAAQSLPPENGFAMWDLEIDPKKVPSCQNVSNQNMMLNQLYNSSCILNSLMMVAPLKYSLPAMMTGI